MPPSGTANKHKANSERGVITALASTLNGSKGTLGIITAMVTLAVLLSKPLSAIQTDLYNNCDAVNDVGKAVIGVVAVDDELAEKKNKPLRNDLIRQLRKQDDCKK